jgi:hypothetical protein
MITFKQYVAEMATPRESDKAKVYYHGTNNEKAARGIWEQGLDPVHTEIKYSGKRTKSNFKPQQDRVYITTDLPYAMIYGIGGDMAGSDCTRDIKVYGQYGFVFEFTGTAFNDIVPDEDSIGEFLYYLLNQNSKWHQADEKYAIRNEKLKPIGKELVNMAKAWLSVRDLEKIKDGDIEYWAKGGKKLISKMDDEFLLKIVDCGAHLGHAGKLHPSKCYRFDRADVIHMKHDGSNFFEYAKAWKP